MNEFFLMGGYAEYVWSAFLLSVFVLLANAFVARTSFKAVRAGAKQRASVRQQNNRSK